MKTKVRRHDLRWSSNRMMLAAPPLAIPQVEFGHRLDAVRHLLAARRQAAAVLFDPLLISYLTGFAHSPTERPIVLVVPTDGDPGLLLPRLEREHVAERVPLVRHSWVYPEYPHRRHPMLVLADALAEIGLDQAPLAVDADGAGGRAGYRGPALSEVLPGAPLTNLRLQLTELRRVKSPAEIALIRACVPFGDDAVRRIVERIRPGDNEIAVGLEVMAEAGAAMMRALGPAYRGIDNGSLPVRCGVVGGPKTALPHPIDDARPLRAGDMLIPWGCGEIGGYHSELERTFFLGEPSPEQRRLFAIMREAQQVAFAAIRPGVPCRDVDAAVEHCFVEQGVADLTRHHTGHGVGLEIHEAPFLDVGDETVLEPGMVLSCEPGLYLPGVGGFRHSDTVLVTETGSEVLTGFPRDIDAMTLDA